MTALMLFFFLYALMVAQSAACQTLSNACLKSTKTWYRSCWCCRYFSQIICRLKICSVVVRPALKPACFSFSAMIFSACCFNLFSIIFRRTLLGRLTRLIVRQLCHSWRLPFLGRVIISDWVHGVGYSPLFQILLQIVVSAPIVTSPPAWSNSVCILFIPAAFPFFSDFYSYLNFILENRENFFLFSFP